MESRRDEHVGQRTNSVIDEGWNTLDELRALALAQGCTPAQFQCAVESSGNDPHDVAN
jgi:hypothetical protein